ncbi:MAG: TlpA family protein disulfide reductase [Chryseotalea sp.]|jgi:thiol-disulfide isomerase/thioredoxin
MKLPELRVPLYLLIFVIPLFVLVTTASNQYRVNSVIADSVSYTFSLIDMNQKSVPFHQYRGKVVLVNLWATWCGPCRAELPSLQKLQQSYLHPDFEIVAISLDKQSDNQKVNNYLLQNNFTFPVYYPDQNFPKVLQVRAIPSSFLIDKKRQIVWHKTGVENFNKASFRKKIDALVK